MSPIETPFLSQGVARMFVSAHKFLIVGLQSIVLRCAAAIVGCFLCFGSPAVVLAQTAEINELEDLSGKMIDLTPFKNDPRRFTQVASQMLGFLQTGKANNDQERALFDSFYTARIGELTWPTAGTVEAKRVEIKRRYLKGNFASATSPELHDRANALLVKHLPKLAGNQQISFHSRYAALMLLGQLDKIEYNLSTSAPPVPLPEATTLLLDAAGKVEFGEALRIAAMIGLQRHSELQLPAQSRADISSFFLKFIASKKPLEGFSIEGHHWARRLGLQSIVGLLKTGNEPNQPPAVKGLTEILTDAQEPLFLRREAALALGYLDPALIAAAGPNQTAELLKALANLTREVANAGGPRPDPTAPISLTKGADVFITPDDDPATKKLFAEGVGVYLISIATGLGGPGRYTQVAPALANRGLKSVPGLDKASGPGQLIDQLLKDHIDPMLVALQKTTSTSSQLAQEMSAKGIKLASWLEANKLTTPPAKVVGGGGN